MLSVSKVCLGPSTAAVAQILDNEPALWDKSTTQIVRKAFATRESILIELERLL